MSGSARKTLPHAGSGSAAQASSTPNAKDASEDATIGGKGAVTPRPPVVAAAPERDPSSPSSAKSFADELLSNTKASQQIRFVVIVVSVVFVLIHFVVLPKLHRGRRFSDRFHLKRLLRDKGHAQSENAEDDPIDAAPNRGGHAEGGSSTHYNSIRLHGRHVDMLRRRRQPPQGKASSSRRVASAAEAVPPSDDPSSSLPQEENTEESLGELNAGPGKKKIHTKQEVAKAKAVNALRKELVAREHFPPHHPHFLSLVGGLEDENPLEDSNIRSAKGGDNGGGAFPQDGYLPGVKHFHGHHEYQAWQRVDQECVQDFDIEVPIFADQDDWRHWERIEKPFLHCEVINQTHCRYKGGCSTYQVAFNSTVNRNALGDCGIRGSEIVEVKRDQAMLSGCDNRTFVPLKAPQGAFFGHFVDNILPKLIRVLMRDEPRVLVWMEPDYSSGDTMALARKLGIELTYDYPSNVRCFERVVYSCHVLSFDPLAAQEISWKLRTAFREGQRRTGALLDAPSALAHQGTVKGGSKPMRAVVGRNKGGGDITSSSTGHAAMKAQSAAVAALPRDGAAGVFHSTADDLRPKSGGGEGALPSGGNRKQAPQGGRRVYASRLKGTRNGRQMQNEAEFAGFLKKHYAFEIYEGGEGLDRWATSLADAAVLVGPHGTAMSHMLWLDPANRPLVIELDGFDKFAVFWFLARSLGATYAWMHFDPGRGIDIAKFEKFFLSLIDADPATVKLLYQPTTAAPPPSVWQPHDGLALAPVGHHPAAGHKAGTGAQPSGAGRRNDAAPHWKGEGDPADGDDRGGGRTKKHGVILKPAASPRPGRRRQPPVTSDGDDDDANAEPEVALPGEGDAAADTTHAGNLRLLPGNKEKKKQNTKHHHAAPTTAAEEQQQQDDNEEGDAAARPRGAGDDSPAADDDEDQPAAPVTTTKKKKKLSRNRRRHKDGDLNG